jgi:hypothetical protein
MTQKLARSVGAGDVVALLVIALSVLPNGVAGERFALAGLLFAAWVALSGGLAPRDRGGQPGQLCNGHFVAATLDPPGSSTRVETGARRAGRALRT